MFAGKGFTDSIASIIASLNGVLYKGTIDCSGNPNYPAADAGYMYIVSVAGKIGGASGTDVVAGDSMICNTDGTAAGNEATVGTKWNIFEKNITIQIVAQGGTGLSTITDHGIMLGSGTGAVTPMAELVTGALVVGVTGADPTPVAPNTAASQKFLAMTGTGSVGATPTWETVPLIDLASPGAIGGTTAGTIRALFDEDTFIATGNLSANQASAGVINNYGQTNDCAITWPTIVEGQSCVFRCATTVAKYWRVVAPASIYIWLDGVKGSAAGYVGIASATEGACFQITSCKNTGGTYDLMATTISGSIVAG
jgi:hypothetical protein